jgi:hypothetical protein
MMYFNKYQIVSLSNYFISSGFEDSYVIQSNVQSNVKGIASASALNNCFQYGTSCINKP